MELTDLILKLNSEAAQNTPDVYKKVMAAARKEGLVKSKEKKSPKRDSYDDYDYNNYDYDYDYDYSYSSRSSAPRGSGIGRTILSWIIAIIIIVLSITFLTITIKIVVPVGGGTETPPASPDTTETSQLTQEPSVSEYELVID